MNVSDPAGGALLIAGEGWSRQHEGNMKRKTVDPDIEDLLRRLRRTRLHEPPRDALAAAAALGERLKPRGRGLREWIATLVFDSATTPLAVGVRGADAAERRLLYEVRRGGERAELDLRVRRDARGRLEIVGQLLPPWRDATVEIRGSRGHRAVPLGAHGEFRFSALVRPRAGYALTVRRGGRAWGIPKVPGTSRDPEERDA